MTQSVAEQTEIAKRRATQRALLMRDIAMLPKYEDAAVCLRPSPIGIAEGTRRARPRMEVQPNDPEASLRQAQMDYYQGQQAHGLLHTFDYDPCRSR